MFERTKNKILSREERETIARVIEEIEKQTSAEVRVGIRWKRKFTERHLPLPELALKEFYFLEMDKTGMRTGVFFFFLIAEKQFRIILDETINKQIDQAILQQTESTLAACFQNNNFYISLKSALQILEPALSSQFPILHNDVNELSNEVSIR